MPTSNSGGDTLRVTPQVAAEKLATILTAWEKETGYIMISEGQDTIVATIDPDTGGWRHAFRRPLRRPGVGG